MSLQEQEKLERRREEVITSKFVAERFFDILAKKDFSIHRINFNVESVSYDPDGTRHTAVVPAELKEVGDFGDAKGQFLIRDKFGTLNYFLEFETIDHRDGSDHFVGITQVQSPEVFKDKGEWSNKVLSDRVRPSLYGDLESETNFRPRLRVQTSGSGRLMVEIFEEDFHLEDLYDLLTGHPPYPQPDATT